MGAQSTNVPPPRYLFFFSYARLDDDEYLKRFFDDLTASVARKAGVHEPSFKDLRIIRPGDSWPAELVEALEHSQTLLCLYSPWYFKREFCGKEFHFFLDRQGVEIPEIGVVIGVNRIIPVLWLGERDLTRNGFPPAVLRSIQLTLPDSVPAEYRGRYKEDGLQGILQQSGRRGAYHRIVNLLADEIITRSDPDLPPLATQVQLASIRNAFEVPPSRSGGGPNVLRVYCVTEKQDTLDVSELFTDGTPITLPTFLKECSLRVERMFTEQIDPTDASALLTLEEALRTATDRNELILVIGIPTSGSDTTVRLLQQIAELENWRGCVVILATAEVAVDSSRIAASARTSQEDLLLVRTFAGAAAEFRTTIMTLVRELQRAVVSAGSVHQQVDAEGPARRPNIEGPRKTGGP